MIKLSNLIIFISIIIIAIIPMIIGIIYQAVISGFMAGNNETKRMMENRDRYL